MLPPPDPDVNQPTPPEMLWASLHPAVRITIMILIVFPAKIVIFLFLNLADIMRATFLLYVLGLCYIIYDLYSRIP